MLRKVTLGFNNDARKLERIIFNSFDNQPASRIPEFEADIHLIASKIEAGWQTKFKYENENVTSDQVKVGQVFHILSIGYGNASVTSNIGQMSEGKYDYDLVVSYNSSLQYTLYRYKQQAVSLPATGRFSRSDKPYRS